MAVVLLALPVGLAWKPPQHTAHRARASMVAQEPDTVSGFFPNEAMTPIRVVEVQLSALQHGNAQVYWRFVSPEGKRDTGILRPAHYAYLAAPDYRTLPTYAPLWRSLRFEVVGALSTSKTTYQCRARVWPSGGERECCGQSIEAPIVEYIWKLALQPEVRPVCYDYDPLQQGISAGPPFGGCWLVDDVSLDARWGGGGDGPADATPPEGGGEQKTVRRQRSEWDRVPQPVA